MSISAVTCYQQNIQKPAFKGKWDRTEQGTPYYKTCSAMKIGGSLAGLSALSTLMTLGASKMATIVLKEGNKEIDKKTQEVLQSLLKKGKKATIISGAVALAAYLGPAAYIDHKRNEKAKEVANHVQQVGVKNAVMNSNEVALSNKGHAYYDSNVGAKNGAWLGAVAGAIICMSSFFNYKSAKNAENEIKNLPFHNKEINETLKAAKKANKFGMAVNAAISVGFSALGGWLLGKWSDNIANNDARKHV